MAEKIREESQRFDVSFADIVRECVEVELPKLKDRFCWLLTQFLRDRFVDTV